MLTGANVLEAIGPSDVIGEQVAASHFMDISVTAAPRRAGYVSVKVVTEWLVAFVLIVLTAPLMVVLALLVKLTSPGPAFYAQTRLGQYGRKYRILKLRTMVHNAETRTGPVWASKNDVRITPLGRVLRGTHLDELPQLWNVVRGEMSLIGPRPERPEIACRVQRRVSDFHLRLLVRPGVTGLAQMLLPADDPNDVALAGLRRKLAYDLYYVREVSVLLDLRIAICTPCYFLAAAIDAVRQNLLRSHGAAADRVLGVAETDDEGCERAA
jgi:lipopolysaccharide/colanic/teichoic acid biosynthesis glycosyltransferase